MPPVTKTEDQLNLVETKDFPFATFSFEKFNPIQSRIMEFYDKETNGLIAASTSGGKTVVAEQFFSYEIRKRGGKGMYLVPLRALAREKLCDWTNKKHHFGDLKISICTGDYRLTKERAKELEEADLIVMTSEMLSARCRNENAEHSEFLKSISTLVVDEAHLLGSKGRGDHLEMGLMKFTKINPNCRLILLSATMPNVEEIADWVSYSLTKKDTFILRSKFRPVPLTVHYETYDDYVSSYDAGERNKVHAALDIVKHYPKDKFLIFTHTKATGELMKSSLKRMGIDVEFHNADLEGAKRAIVEDRFRNDPKLRIIVATSTLSAGLNLPARRAILLGVHRAKELVDSVDIVQMIGRAGRLGLDPMGDAYILLPESQKNKLRTVVTTVLPIESQLLEKFGDKYKKLSFHIVSEINNGEIKTTDDIHNWYKRTLAYFQNQTLSDPIINNIMESLKRCGAVWQEDDVWNIRPIGKVASMFYYSPFDVSDLYFNFKILFENNRQDDDYFLSLALSNVDSQRTAIVSKAEKEEFRSFSLKLRGKLGRDVADPICKAAFCYFNLLNGHNSLTCGSLQKNLKFDFNRTVQVLQSLDAFAGKWKRYTWWKNLEGRIANGVAPHLLDLCKIPNVGKVKANKLYTAGIKDVKELLLNEEKSRKVLNMKQESFNKLVEDAKKING